MPPRRPRQNTSDRLGPPPAPDASGSRPERIPIGMPEEFAEGIPQRSRVAIERRDNGWEYPMNVQRPERRPVRYFLGDEMEPMTWGDRERVERLQRQLVDLGLLDSYIPGYWDQNGANAYMHVLAYANQWDMSAEQALIQLPARVEDELAQQGRETPPLTVRLTPADDLRQLFRRATTELTGMGWSRSEVDAAIRAYHDVERSRQQAEYEMTYSGSRDPEEDFYGTGGELEGPPSPEAFIEARVMEQDPEGMQAHQMLGLAQETLQFIGSPAYGAGIGR